ncbi:MAG TPA: hypothetical protein VFY47_10220 [Thermoleophilaceae bacterium]|nr:hypothetical protein [Thermoleophilaceae bacterium]HEX5955051.1 hypothetical protein [Solirubrobacterales bacterium]
MPGLRLLLRMAPFIVGAIAAAVWLQRRTPQRVALPAPPAPPQLEPRYEPVDIVTVVDDLLAAGR